MGKFQDLKVWQRGKDLAVSVYKVTGGGSFYQDYGLRDQIRRAAVSIPSNIAEGDELGTDKQAVRFFYMAKGSCAEVLTQTIIACEIGYLAEEDFIYIEKECRSLSGMLTRLIQSRSSVVSLKYIDKVF
jgi:four helix bundle protein